MLTGTLRVLLIRRGVLRAGRSLPREGGASTPGDLRPGRPLHELAAGVFRRARGFGSGRQSRRGGTAHAHADGFDAAYPWEMPGGTQELISGYEVCPADCDSLDVSMRTLSELEEPRACPKNCGNNLEWVTLKVSRIELP